MDAKEVTLVNDNLYGGETRYIFRSIIMPTIAHKTIAAIDAAILQDKGASFRLALKEILPKMDDAYRGEEDAHRSHFGFSNIGETCARKLWFSWKWVLAKAFPARILRLFNRGHLEEARFLAMLVSAGFDVHYETPGGGQFRIVDHNGHAGSAIDAVVVGIPDLPEGTPALTEMKTHSDKYFKLLVRKGVREGFWKHYVQMQVYMRKHNLSWGLYMAVNKNDDELYCELISFDPAVADRYIERAGMILNSDEAPPRVNDSPGWYECKYCDYNKLCHQAVLPDINCRTCLHSSPVEDAKWHCVHHNVEISKADQLQGCNTHIFNPHLLNGAEIIDGNSDEGWMKITWCGQNIHLGEGGITSHQMARGDV